MNTKAGISGFSASPLQFCAYLSLLRRKIRIRLVV